MREERYADTRAKVRRRGAAPSCQRGPSLGKPIRMLERGCACQHGKARLIGITVKKHLSNYTMQLSTTILNTDATIQYVCSTTLN